MKMMAGIDKDPVTISVPKCPLCNQGGEFRYTGLKDRVWFAPGEWTYRACDRCETLWLDLRPTSECFGVIYPSDYLTHGEPVDPLSPRSGFVANLMLEVKLGVLRRAYGYALNPSKPIARLIAVVVARVPGIKRWVGYTVRFLPSRKGRLLDVGCGNGEFLLSMSKLGWEVKGIEPDMVSASLARKAGLEVYQGFVESTPLEPDSFDAITLNHVIEHLSHPVETLKKLIDALRPGGLLVSISPNPSSSLARWFGGAWRGLEPPRHLVLPGPRALVDMAKRFGLEPVVWTTSRNSEWMARESISILRHGDVKTYQGRYLPRLIAMGCKVLTIINDVLGEEVVLIARKK